MLEPSSKTSMLSLLDRYRTTRTGEKTRTLCEWAMYNDPEEEEWDKGGKGKWSYTLKTCNMFNRISRYIMQITQIKYFIM